MKNISLIIVCLLYSFILSAQESTEIKELIENKQNNLEFSETELTHVKGTNVQMIPPAYFEQNESIKGFIHPGSSSTIQVVEIEGSGYKTIDDSMTPEHIEQQNYKLQERREVVLNSGEKGVIYFVRFNADDGTEFERAMLFTGERNTIWVNFNYPLSMKNLLKSAVEKSLLSVKAK